MKSTWGSAVHRASIGLSNILIGREFGIETYLDGKQPLMEDNLQWKMTFDGRQLSMEDDIKNEDDLKYEDEDTL